MTTTDMRTITVELPSLAVIDASGADAAAFLQGQLSNDLADLGSRRACLAGYCNPKGRLLALPLVLGRRDGGARLVVPREIAAGLAQRLRMFVLRADVVFELREDLRCRGLLVAAESAADAPLAHGIAALPPRAPVAVLELVDAPSEDADAQICRWHDAPPPLGRRRYLAIAGRFSTAADEGVTLAGVGGETLWRLGDILAGVPRVGEALREAFVPQMVNLEQVGGLSFRKGCYPGQEIVARMQYLGKLKRHMRRFRADLPAAPAAGTALASGDESDAGRVVDAVASADGVELLAVVRIGVDPATLRVGDAPLEPRPLPYAPPGGTDAAAAAPSG